MITNANNIRNVIYDPAYGRDIREIKATRIFNISHAGTQISAAGGAIASSVVGASQNIVITAVGVGKTHGTTTPSVGYITVGSSTICPMGLTATNMYQSIVATRNEPLSFATNTTIALRGNGSGTWCGFVSGVIEPIISKCEV